MPGEQGVVIGALNAFVHIIMYFYYMVSAMGPQYHKYLWWKKYLTWLQLTQFALMLIYLGLVAAFNCKKFHKILTYFFLVNVAFFLYLFALFYIKTYRATVYDSNKKGDSTDTSKKISIDHQVNGVLKMHKTL